VAKATDLLERIEQGALDSGTPLADSLRLCVALGGRAGSAELRDWARKELDGYGANDDLPDYRVVTVPILIDGSNFRAIIAERACAPVSFLLARGCFGRGPDHRHDHQKDDGVEVRGSRRFAEPSRSCARAAVLSRRQRCSELG
jgi:hypothetical protein